MPPAAWKAADTQLISVLLNSCRKAPHQRLGRIEESRGGPARTHTFSVRNCALDANHVSAGGLNLAHSP